MAHLVSGLNEGRLESTNMCSCEKYFINVVGRFIVNLTRNNLHIIPPYTTPCSCMPPQQELLALCLHVLRYEAL
jgi:hypothetical protein